MVILSILQPSLCAPMYATSIYSTLCFYLEKLLVGIQYFRYERAVSHTATQQRHSSFACMTCILHWCKPVHSTRSSRVIIVVSWIHVSKRRLLQLLLVATAAPPATSNAGGDQVFSPLAKILQNIHFPFYIIFF